MVELTGVEPILRPPQRSDDMLADRATIAAALDDLQVRALANGLATEEHAGLSESTTRMHFLASNVNAIHATNVALHLWSISGPRPPKTAEIRPFPQR